MPKIPVVTRQVSIPRTSGNAEMNIGAAGIVGESIERAGKTQMGAVDQLAKVLEKRQNEQDNIKLSDLRNEYVKWGIGYEAEQIEKKKGKDAYDVVDTAKVDLENKKQEFLKNVDSRLIPHAQNILDIENNRSLDKLTLHALREGEVAKATAKRETIDLAAQRIATISDSPSETQEEIALTTQILERLGANPVEVNTATAQMVVVATQTAINNNDIASAKEHIANNKVLLDATGLRDDLERKLKSAEIEDTQNNIYASLRLDYNLDSENPDYEGAIKELRNPDNFQSLNTDQRQRLENQLRSQQGYDEKVQKEELDKRYESELDQIGDLITKGQIGQAMKILNNSEAIPGMEKVKINKAFAEYASVRKSDIRTYLDGVDIMYDPDTPMTDKKKWLLENRGRLNDTDIKHLAANGLSQERKSSVAATKQGIKLLEEALIFPDMKGPTAEARLRKAVTLYESGLKEYADTLKTPDQKRDYVYQILKMPYFANVNPMEDMREDVKKLRGVGISKPVPAATEPIKTEENLSDVEQELSKRGYKKNPETGKWGK